VAKIKQTWPTAEPAKRTGKRGNYLAGHCLKLLLVQSIESESGSGPNHRTDLLLPFLQGYRPIFPTASHSPSFHIIFCLLDFCLSFLSQLACERIICKNYLPCCRPGCSSCSLIVLHQTSATGRGKKYFFHQSILGRD